MKYLGFWIGEEMNCAGHVEKMVERVRGHFNKMAYIAKVRCGYSNRSMSILYKGLILSVMTYASEFWGGAMAKKKCRESLLRVQRQIIIRVNKAYRTISREANLVIAGLPPLDLIIEERLDRRRDKLAGLDIGESRRNRRRELLDKWQERWRYRINVGRHWSTFLMLGRE